MLLTEEPNLYKRINVLLTYLITKDHHTMRNRPDAVCLSYQVTVHAPTTLGQPVLDAAFNALVDYLDGKGVMVGYHVADFLGRDLVPVEEPKQY